MSVAEQAGLNVTRSQTSEDTFSLDGAHIRNEEDTIVASFCLILIAAAIHYYRGQLLRSRPWVRAWIGDVFIYPWPRFEYIPEVRLRMVEFNQFLFICF